MALGLLLFAHWGFKGPSVRLRRRENAFRARRRTFLRLAGQPPAVCAQPLPVPVAVRGATVSRDPHTRWSPGQDHAGRDARDLEPRFVVCKAWRHSLLGGRLDFLAGRAALLDEVDAGVLRSPLTRSRAATSPAETGSSSSTAYHLSALA